MEAAAADGVFVCAPAVKVEGVAGCCPEIGALVETVEVCEGTGTFVAEEFLVPLVAIEFGAASIGLGFSIGVSAL